MNAKLPRELVVSPFDSDHRLRGLITESAKQDFSSKKISKSSKF